MLEPVELKDFFIVFFSGAMVIMSGALYALLFAWSRLQSKHWMMSLAYLSYAVLFTSVMVLGNAAHLHGFWWSLVITMLLGYLLAPHGIWKLCVATHAVDDKQCSDTP
jgi:uncharacterized membrane protein HdeD (DUF308 family)